MTGAGRRVRTAICQARTIHSASCLADIDHPTTRREKPLESPPNRGFLPRSLGTKAPMNLIRGHHYLSSPLRLPLTTTATAALYACCNLKRATRRLVRPPWARNVAGIRGAPYTPSIVTTTGDAKLAAPRHNRKFGVRRARVRANLTVLLELLAANSEPFDQRDQIPSPPTGSNAPTAPRRPSVLDTPKSSVF